MGPRLTTKAHYALFQKEVKECLERWGVNDMEVYFDHKKIKDARASFDCDDTTRIATVSLSTHWEKDNKDSPAGAVTAEEVKATARHESVHALLFAISRLPGSFCTESEAEEAEERVVQRLLRILP